MVQINKEVAAGHPPSPQPKQTSKGLIRYAGIAILVILGLTIDVTHRVSTFGGGGGSHAVRGASVADADNSRLHEILAHLENVQQHVQDQTVSMKTLQNQQSLKMDQLASDLKTVKEGMDHTNKSPEQEAKDKQETSQPVIHLPGKPAPHAMFLPVVSANNPSPDLFDDVPIDLGTPKQDGTRTAQAFYFPKACHEIKRWVMELSPQEIKITQLFQQSFTSAMTNTTSSLDDRPLFVDVGSNCGFYSLLAAAHGLQVEAYDLQPTCVQHVATSAAHHGWQNRIHVHLTGLSDGIERWFDGSTFATGCFGAFPARPGPLDDSQSIERVSVPLTSIDERYNRHHPVHFLKADTEGNEIKVMQGAMQSFEHHVIQNAIIEFTPSFWTSRGYQKQDALDALCQILRFGYQISWHLEEVYFQDCDAIVAFFDSPWKLLSQDLLFQLK